MKENVLVGKNLKDTRKNIRIGATIGAWFAFGYLFAFVADTSLFGVTVPGYIWYPLWGSIGALIGFLSLIFRANRKTENNQKIE